MTDLLANTQLTHHEFVVLFLSLGILLATARLLGEVALRLGQPAVLGEILAGVLLGATVLGNLAPAANAFLFPGDGYVPASINALSSLAITLFLLVAGMEVDLSTVWRQGKSAFAVAAAGMVVPFVIGFGGGYFVPDWFRLSDGADPFVGALFIGTALSISALPVIAKILMDLNMYRTDMGMIVVAAAIFNDLAGWMIFAFLLGMMGHEAGEDGGLGVGQTVVFTILFVGLILTVGRWLIDRSLPWVQAHLSWPGGIIGMVLATALLCAALTEWIGIHSIFGAFLFGVALGDSRHLREQTRATLDQFISFFFAPLFFATIGLNVDFIANFDFWLVLLVLVIATAGKVLGCGLGARISGFPPRESWAIGFGMNARGAMEIILGLLALQVGLIGERLFVALVIMALVTSVTSGSLMQRVLRTPKPVRFTEYLTAGRFRRRLEAEDSRAAITELVALAGETVPLDTRSIEQRVWFREEQTSTGLGNGVAVPHARVPGLKTPVVAVGISESGINFNSRDGKPARVICLLLVPFNDQRTQIEMLGHIGRTFKDPRTTDKVVEAESYTEFLAVLKSEVPAHAPRGEPAPA